MNTANPVRVNAIKSHETTFRLLFSDHRPSFKMAAGIIFFSTSPPQRPVCVVGKLGRKEKRALSIFSIIAIFNQQEPLRIREFFS